MELRPARELLEARVAAERIEVGVDAQPSGREVAGNLQQRLEKVQRPLVVPDEDVDPHGLALDVRALEAFFWIGPSATTPSASRIASALRPR